MFLKRIWILHHLNILIVRSAALEDTAIFRSSACYPVTKCWGEITVVAGIYNSPTWPFCSFTLSVQPQESAHLVLLHHNKMVFMSVRMCHVHKLLNWNKILTLNLDLLTSTSLSMTPPRALQTRLRSLTGHWSNVFVLHVGWRLERVAKASLKSKWKFSFCSWVLLNFIS